MGKHKETEPILAPTLTGEVSPELRRRCREFALSDEGDDPEARELIRSFLNTGWKDEEIQGVLRMDAMTFTRLISKFPGDEWSVERAAAKGWTGARRARVLTRVDTSSDLAVLGLTDADFTPRNKTDLTSKGEALGVVYLPTRE
jgi:hypothetical protein